MKYLFVLAFLSTSICYSQNWLVNFDEAKANAKEKNHKVILVFSGSDWCAPCMKLEREIWDSDVFKSYAKTNYVLLKADFPRRKKNSLSKSQQDHNNKLAEQYNKNGYFPLVVVLNANGKVLGEAGYKKMKPQDYIDWLNSF